MHELCRAMNGKIQPSASCVAVNVGNNNIDRDPPSKIADDTIAIGRKFQEALPKVKVMLAGLLPRDEGYSFCRDRKQELLQAPGTRGFTTCPQTSSLHQGQMAI